MQACYRSAVKWGQSGVQGTAEPLSAAYLLERLPGDLHGGAPALHDGHGVDALVDQELRLAQQLAAQHRHTGRGE